MTSTYEDRSAQLSPGLAMKVPVKVQSTAPVVLNGEKVVNTVALVSGDRVLIVAQANPVDNGIWIVSTGAWTRAQDFDGTRDATNGTLIPVIGPVFAIYRLVATTNPVAIGTDAMTFILAGLSLLSVDAANVSFIQTGTGAVTRTGLAKMRDVVSVTDFGAVGDGVNDDTAEIQAAIDSGHRTIYFPAGTYKTSDQILVQGKDGTQLIGESSANTTIKYAGVQSATKAVIKIQTSSYCLIEDLYITSKSGASVVIADSLAAFGVYITTEGNNPLAQQNLVRHCQINFCATAGVQIGHATVNADVTVDSNAVEDNQIAFCGNGIRVYGTNTNLTRIQGGAVYESTGAGIEIGMNARCVKITGPLMYHHTTADFLIRKENQGPIQISDMVTELIGNDTFLIGEVTGGGLVDFNLLTLQNIYCTNNNTDPAKKIIDYQGTGSVAMRNCRWAGGASTSGGAGAKLSFQPSNGASAGAQWLITENTFLYDGANFDVQTTNVNAHFKWLDIGTWTVPGSDPNATTGEGSAMRTLGGVQWENLTNNALALAAGGTINSVGRMSRTIYKVTIDKAAWTAAALTHDFILATFPAKTNIVGAYCDTTTAFAGLAGTITLQIGTAGGTPNNLILAHDVKTAVVTKGLADADLGAGLARATAVQGGIMPSFASSHQPQARLTSSVGNIGTGAVTNLTFGVVSIYLITEVMP